MWSLWATPKEPTDSNKQPVSDIQYMIDGNLGLGQSEAN